MHASNGVGLGQSRQVVILVELSSGVETDGAFIGPFHISAAVDVHGVGSSHAVGDENSLEGVGLSRERGDEEREVIEQ